MREHSGMIRHVVCVYQRHIDVSTVARFFYQPAYHVDPCLSLLSFPLVANRAPPCLVA